MQPWIHSLIAGFGGSVLFQPLEGSQSLLSVAYIIQKLANCFSLLVHWMRLAANFALAKAGKSIAARMAMMAMTTRSSMSVNPVRPERDPRITTIFRRMSHNY